MEKILQIPLFRLFSLSVLRRFQGLIKRGPSVPSKLRQRIPGSQKHPRKFKGGEGGGEVLGKRSHKLWTLEPPCLSGAQELNCCPSPSQRVHTHHFRPQEFPLSVSLSG